jgi:hypothetical protein
MSVKPVAILVSDLHLQARTPVGRAETDWMGQVLTPMAQALRDVQASYDKCPIICAGDVFDHWSPPVEVVNWAIDNLPKMWAIPGQHDLPGHRYADRMRGGYGTLVRAGVLHDLDQVRLDVVPGWCVVPAPWGCKVPPAPLGRSLLVAHVYTAHTPQQAYTGAPVGCYLGNTVEQRRYTVSLYGDNHHPWGYQEPGGTYHFNHGAWVRRTRTEAQYPAGGVGVLWSNGTVDRVPCGLPEAWVEAVEAPKSEATYAAYVAACRAAALSAVPFTERLQQAAATATPPVAQVLTEVKEHCSHEKPGI